MLFNRMALRSLGSLGTLLPILIYGALTHVALAQACDAGYSYLYGVTATLRTGNNQVRTYAETWVTGYYMSYFYPKAQLTAWLNSNKLAGPETASADPGQHALKAWSFMPSTIGVGRYQTTAVHWAESPYCAQFGWTPTYYPSQSENTVERPARPDYASFSGAVYYLGSGILFNGNYRASATLLPGDPKGAVGTPQWAFTAGSGFGTLSCTSCQEPVFTATRRSTACLAYDVVIKTSYDGLDSEPFYVFINAPYSTIAALDSVGGVWDYSRPYYDGYYTQIHYKTKNLCAFDSPMSGYSINETFDSNWENAYAGANWRHGPATGTDVPGDQWWDWVNFWTDPGNCVSIPCVPTPLNPGPDYTPVHWVWQSWRAGSPVPGQGVRIQKNKLWRYRDQALHPAASAGLLV